MRRLILNTIRVIVALLLGIMVLQLIDIENKISEFCEDKGMDRENDIGEDYCFDEENKKLYKIKVKYGCWDLCIENIYLVKEVVTLE